MPAPLPLTVVVINFQTPDLTTGAVRSLRRFYPDVPLLLVDNGSGDESPRALEELRQLQPEKTELLLNVTNFHHGPAMDQALRLLETPYVLFLDSDCVVERGGFLEAMLGLAAAEPRGYAVGKKIFMNDRGFDVEETPGAHPYIRPICMLVHRERYLELPPFERHGAPCLANMRAAAAAGLALLHFPVEEYVRHLGRGTASRHGYRLGWRGRLNHLLNRIGL
ncbi:MAG TPA: glycosyltransferase [Bacteroidota bacterium]